MSTGDQSDMALRVKRVLPHWFGYGPTPVLDALMTAPAVVFAGIYDLYTYAKLQLRIRTATGPWLDLIARDFFGADLKRRSNQSDAAFRSIILASVFAPRATRPAIRQAILALTGNEPRIFETNRAADTGGYGVMCAYGFQGGWGDETLRAQVFIDVKRPTPSPIPNVSGYNQSAGGLNTSSPLEWAHDVTDIAAIDAEIYAMLDRVRPVGVILWVHISDGDPARSLVGGGTPYGDTAHYSDGSENYQPPALI